MRIPYGKAGVGVSFLAFALVAGGCGSGYSTQRPAPVAVSGVKVTPQSVQIAGVGGTTQLTVVVTPLDAADRVVSWESSDPSIATVDAAGRVTGRGVGAGVFVTALTHDGHFQG